MCYYATSYQAMPFSVKLKDEFIINLVCTSHQPVTFCSLHIIITTSYHRFYYLHFFVIYILNSSYIFHLCQHIFKIFRIYLFLFKLKLPIKLSSLVALTLFFSIKLIPTNVTPLTNIIQYPISLNIL